MSETTPRLLETQPLTRREVIKKAAGLGALALGGVAIPPSYRSAREAYLKVRAIGNDYSNDPFLLDAERIKRDRLNELLAASQDTALPSYRVNKNWQESGDSLAEYAFFTTEPGPVYAELPGLQGSDTSLVVLSASVDDGEDYLIPLIRDPEDQTPISIQLGSHEPGRHRLNIDTIHGEVDGLEIEPFFTQGAPESFRSLVDSYQPLIFPFKQDDVDNNFPVRTFAFAYETPDEIALVFWKECVGEDKEYGRIGTSAQQLYSTKRRTTDYDWDLEVLIDKYTLQPKLVNIAEPYHNRVNIPIEAAPHTLLRVASTNNNVELVSPNWAQNRPRIAHRPSIHVHDERWQVLYSTTPAIGRLSAKQHIKKGHLDPNNPTDAIIIHEAGFDVNPD